jgi:hypothetical protein
VCFNPTQVCANPTQVCVNLTQVCVNPTQVRLLNRLAGATGRFVPVSSLLLEVLQVSVHTPITPCVHGSQLLFRTDISPKGSSTTTVTGSYPDVSKHHSQALSLTRAGMGAEQFKELNKAPVTEGKSKPPEFATLLKVPKTVVRTPGFQNEVVLQVRQQAPSAPSRSIPPPHSASHSAIRARQARRKRIAR